MKMNDKLFAKGLTALILIPPCIGLTLGITVAEQFKKTDYYKEHIGTTAVIVDNYVEDVNNSTTTQKIVEEKADVIITEYEEPAYADDELEILAIIIYQEAGSDNCSDDTRRKVGSVFLNRVSSSLFPSTFKEVATQTKQYGTLYLKGIKWPDRASQPQESHAVERAYRIAEELLINGSILPDNVLYQAEFKQGSGVYAYQDDIYFCY